MLLLALVACGGGDDGSAAEAPSEASTSAASPDESDVPDAPSETDGTEPGAEEVDLASTEVCERVREGIDAFNLGDLDGTIGLFTDAVPLAEALADDEPSDDTALLLRAVRYYAELPAADYVEASQTAPEFLRYKEFTLTRCAYQGPPGEATDPAVPA